LFNYSYSTLGILNKFGLHLVGERVDNTFQDLSFNLYFPGGNDKTSFKIWGVGGISREDQRQIDDPDEWRTFKDSLLLETSTRMGVVGTTYNWQINDKSFFKTTAAVMSQRKFEKKVFLQVARIQPLSMMRITRNPGLLLLLYLVIVLIRICT
jgi:hypothetical protein